MPLLFSTPFFNEEMIQAISRTLIHSLWQGMLLAMVAGSIVFFTRHTSASLRYNLLAAALLVFIAGISVTFAVQLTGANSIQSLPSIAAAAAPGAPADAAILIAGDRSIIDIISLFFNQYAGWIVFAWLLIILLKCVQLSNGLYNVYKLKTRQTFSAGEYWNNRLTDLGRQLQVNRKVKLLQSGIAKVPAVIGFLKPVILFPAGMLASLAPQEVEAILIHELAHIRRKDYLVNLLQHILEIVFFFNPAVRWVSFLVRSERENCCDDIALHQTANKRNYINALIAFEDIAVAPQLAHAFAGEKNHLMNRVKRIIYNNNKTLNNMEKKFLAAGLVITSVFIFAFTSKDLQQEIIKAAPAQQPSTIESKNGGSAMVVVNDTIPGEEDNDTHILNGTINSSVNGKKYKIITKNNEVAELYVNGKKIPAVKMGEYKTVINKIMTDAKRDMELAEKDMERAHIEMAEAQLEIEHSQQEILMAKIEIEKAQQEIEEEVKRELEHSKIEMDESRDEIEKVKIEIEQAKKDMKRDMAQAKIELEHARKEIEQSKREIEQSRKEMTQAKLQIEQSQKDMAASKKIQEGVVADFIKEKLVSNKEDLESYELNNEVLIINGVTQPAAVHKKFKDKYVKSKNWSMNYNNKF